jgi:hypothetical protein
MNEILNIYETSYLQIVTILLVKLKQNYPTVYYRAKKRIMSPYLHLCSKARMPSTIKVQPLNELNSDSSQAKASR